MGVIDGQPVSAAYTNPAFIDANQDDTGLGRYTLANTETESGPTLTNIQRLMNAAESFTGLPPDSAYNVLPNWASNEVGSPTDTLKERSDALTERFNGATGHDHTGVDGQGPRIKASDLINVPLRGYIVSGGIFPSGTDPVLDANTIFAGKVPGGSTAQVGVVTAVGFNKLLFRQADGPNTGDVFYDTLGNIVYGRVTDLGPDWFISYFVMLGATETPYSFPLTVNIQFYYQEVFDPSITTPLYDLSLIYPRDQIDRGKVEDTSTGLISGGVLSINGGNNTLFDLSAGTGRVVDYSNPLNVTITPVAWSAFVGVTVNNLLVQPFTYILINSSGAIVQIANYPTPVQRRDNILIGRLTHTNQTFLFFANDLPDMAQSPGSQTQDLSDALGPFNIQGNQITPNGVNLSFQKIAGSMYQRGFNYATTPKNPSIVSLPAQVPVTFAYINQTGAPGAPTTLIDPLNYDLNGVTTLVPNPPATTQIQRVFMAPNGAIRIQRGQNLYNTLAAAIASISSETFVQNPVGTNVTILIGYIVVQKGCINLSDANTARLLPAPRFDTGSGGGSFAVTSLQQAYNNSLSPEIILGTPNLGLEIRDNAVPVGGNLLEVAHSSGTPVYLGVSANQVSTTLPITTSNATVSTTPATGSITTAGGVGVAGAVSIGASTNYSQIATPANPPAGANKVYVKADGNLYILNSSGVETQVGQGGGGSGSTSYSVTAGENLVVGQAVYISSGTDTGGRTLGSAYLLDITNADRIEYAGIVTTAALAGATTVIAVAGKVSGLSGLLTGKPVFASITTPGSFQNNAPNTIGQYIVQVGTADSTTSMLLNGALSATSILVTEGIQPDTEVTQENYITYGNFENNSTIGWGLFTTTFTGLIPTGVITPGAASLSTFNIASTGALAGGFSLRVSSATSWAQAQGFISDPLPIDLVAKGRVLSFGFNYKLDTGTAVFSGTSAGTFAVYLYDVANSAWVQPAGVYNFTQSVGAGLCTGTFQTAINATTYRLAVMAVNASGAPVSMLFDQFFLAQKTGIQTPSVGDWISYTPTLNSNTGVSNNQALYRRVGDSIEVQGRLKFSGTGAATTLTVSLPPGLTVDQQKLPGAVLNINDATGGIGLFGSTWFWHQAGTGYLSGGTASVASTTAVQFTSTTVGGASVLLSSQFLINYAFGYAFSLPVVGWSSNTVSSADTDTRVCAAMYRCSLNTALAATQLINFDVKVIDTHAAVTTGTSTWKFTAPMSGYYRMSAMLSTDNNGGTVGNTFGVVVFKNGIIYGYLNRVVTQTTGATVKASAGGNIMVQLNAGEFVDIRCVNDLNPANNLSGSVATNWVSIERLDGPATVQATESVSMSYQNTAGTAIPSTTDITYPTKIWDSHDSFNGTLYTVPVSGKYQVSANVRCDTVTIATNNNFFIQAVQAGSASVTKIGNQIPGTGVANNYGITITTLFNCLAGDTLKVVAGGPSFTMTAIAGFNTINIHRIGN